MVPCRLYGTSIDHADKYGLDHAESGLEETLLPIHESGYRTVGGHR